MTIDSLMLLGGHVYQFVIGRGTVSTEDPDVDELRNFFYDLGFRILGTSKSPYSTWDLNLHPNLGSVYLEGTWSKPSQQLIITPDMPFTVIDYWVMPQVGDYGLGNGVHKPVIISKVPPKPGKPINPNIPGRPPAIKPQVTPATTEESTDYALPIFISALAGLVIWRIKA